MARRLHLRSSQAGKPDLLDSMRQMGHPLCRNREIGYVNITQSGQRNYHKVAGVDDSVSLKFMDGPSCFTSCIDLNSPADYCRSCH